MLLVLAAHHVLVADALQYDNIYDPLHRIGNTVFLCSCVCASP